jgi:flagellar basal body L-ring protein FlgH
MKIHRLSILNNNEKGRKFISSNDKNKGNRNSRENEKLKGEVTARVQQNTAARMDDG